MAREEASSGIIKRRVNRIYGVFIDGVGLDRATRRLNRRVDMAALVRGVTAGTPAEVARYYTIIPFEDDSRHRAFLDAVERAGLSVEVKRLPPKGVTRQVTNEVEMASDIIAFALGRSISRLTPENEEVAAPRPRILPGGAKRFAANDSMHLAQKPTELEVSVQEASQDTVRVVTIVCPSRELAYPISLARQLGADTVSADFGHFKNEDVLKSAAKWIDLSDSETIWKD